SDCTNVPSVLPGCNPILLNWSSRNLTVSSSPFEPGARPSNSSEESVLMSASMRPASKDGIFATATGAVVLGGDAAAAGCSAEREHAEKRTTKTSTDSRGIKHL